MMLLEEKYKLNRKYKHSLCFVHTCKKTMHVLLWIPNQLLRHLTLLLLCLLKFCERHLQNTFIDQSGLASSSSHRSEAEKASLQAVKSMVRGEICAKILEYKACKNTGISLTKGCDVTLEVFIYRNVYFWMLSHSKVFTITNMGSPPQFMPNCGERVLWGGECRWYS